MAAAPPDDPARRDGSSPEAKVNLRMAAVAVTVLLVALFLVVGASAMPRAAIGKTEAVLLVTILVAAIAVAWRAWSLTHGRERWLWGFLTLALTSFLVAFGARAEGIFQTGRMWAPFRLDDFGSMTAFVFLFLVMVLSVEPIPGGRLRSFRNYLNLALVVVLVFVAEYVFVLAPLHAFESGSVGIRIAYPVATLSMVCYLVLFRRERWTGWMALLLLGITTGAIGTDLFEYALAARSYQPGYQMATIVDTPIALGFALLGLAAAWRLSATHATPPAPADELPRWRELVPSFLTLAAVPVLVIAALSSQTQQRAEVYAWSAVALAVVLIARDMATTAEISLSSNAHEMVDRYRSLVDNAPIAIVVLGRGGRILFANQSAAELAEADTVYDMIGQLVDRFYAPGSGPFPESRYLVERLIADLQNTPSRMLASTPVLRGQLATMRDRKFEVLGTVARISYGGEPALLMQLSDVTKQIQAEAASERYRERLQGLAAELVATEENERRGLARALHDHVSQPLAVARMRLQTWNADAGRSADDFARMLEMIDLAIRETRDLTTELAPPILYELGLEAALRWLAEDTERRYELHVDVSGHLDESLVSDEVRAAVFRATRELLTNVVKHAGVDRAELALREEEGSAFVTVSDDGKGFDPKVVAEEGHFGLFSVGERLHLLGGSLIVVSAPGEGARVTLRVPTAEAAQS